MESFIVEAQNYEDMFNDVRKVLQDTDETISLSFEKSIKDIITRAKSVLKKSNIIVWFLRQWKIGLLISIIRNNPELEKIANPLIDKLIADLANRGGYNLVGRDQYFSMYVSSTNILQKLGHFLSLPIPQIQNYDYGFKPMNNVLMVDFPDYEETWKAQAKELIPYDPTDGEVLIKFNDGYFWQDLKREYCRTEGNAMGHCGNSAAYKNGDTVLSLRQMVKRGDKQYVRPCLTFILQRDGYLGEMKGRANNKPEEKYHKYIVPLLKQDYIKGIRGGGHAADQNFSINDLDEDVRDQLVEEKPTLGTLWDIYRKNGANDKMFRELLQDKVSGTPLEYESIEGNTVVLKTWSNFQRFLSDINDEVLEYYVDIYLEEEDMSLSELMEENISEDDVYDLIEGLSTEDYETLMQRMGIKSAQPNDPVNFKRSIEKAVQLIADNDDYMDPLRNAMTIVMDRNTKLSEALKAKLKEVIKKYIDVYWNFEAYEVGLYINEEDFDDTVSLKINIDTYVAIVSSEDDDDDYSYQKYRVMDSGWEDVDWYGTNQNRKDANLPYEYNRSAKTRSELNKIIGDVSVLEKINFKVFSNTFARILNL